MLQFGSGRMYAVPSSTAGNPSTPAGPQFFGTLQDVNIEINGQNVELRGQSQFPDDIAPGNKSIKGKAAFGNIQIDIFNNLFFADTIVPGGTAIAQLEQDSVPATSTYTITVAQSATFVQDLGVIYGGIGANAGKRFIGPVASLTAAGQYMVNPATGVYTFYSGDASAPVLISYTYAITGGRTLQVINQLMGYGPVFTLYLAQPYQGTNGMILWQCRCSKMSAPEKRDGYTIPDFEFDAYANPGGQVMNWTQVSN